MISHTNGFARFGRSIFAVTCLFGLVTAGCNEFRETPLVRSVPVALVRPADTKTVEWAIESSLAKRHWVVQEHAPGRYVAQLNERGHSVTIAVVYNTANARIDYIDSKNLLYENRPGGEVIHRKYQTWVKNLGEEIKIAATQARAPTGAAPGAPPPGEPPPAAPPPAAPPPAAPAPTAAPK